MRINDLAAGINHVLLHLAKPFAVVEHGPSSTCFSLPPFRTIRAPAQEVERRRGGLSNLIRVNAGTCGAGHSDSAPAVRRPLERCPMTQPMPVRNPGLIASALLILQFILMWSAFFILSSAIGWPASLDDPASIALPRVLDQLQPMLTGYGCYLMVGLLLVPATAALNARLGLSGSLAAFTMALATFSAMAKSIGITRWLFVMPDLAEAYGAPGADQQAIAVVFEALNAYAGGIGEILGVGLVSGVWTLFISAAVFRSGGIVARLIGGFAFISGLVLIATVPAGFGVDLGPILTLSGIVWQFALLAIALWVLLSPRTT